MDHALSEHNIIWKSTYENEKKTIIETQKDNFLEIHHIGSTAISNLISKPQIDIVLSVRNLAESIPQLESLEYVYKGEFNIPFRYFFAKNNEIIKVNLHVVQEKDPEMDGFIVFRDYMRQHPEAVTEYSNLKLSIENKLTSMKKHQYLNEYTLSKDDFIRNILKKAGFKGLCMRFVVHYNEQKYEDTVCQIHNYKINPNDKRFVFYKGPQIIGYANVSATNKLNIFELSEPSSKEYFRKRLLSYITNNIT